MKKIIGFHCKVEVETDDEIVYKNISAPTCEMMLEKLGSLERSFLKEEEIIKE